MPIFGIPNLLINVLSKFVKAIIEKPHLLAFVIVLIFLFPLELIDYLLYYLFNLFIMIFNIIISILVGLLNIIIGFFIGILNWVIAQVFLIVNYLIGLLGFGTIPTPTLPSFAVAYPTIAYRDFNLFGEANAESAGSVIPHNSLF